MTRLAKQGERHPHKEQSPDHPDYTGNETAAQESAQPPGQSYHQNKVYDGVARHQKWPYPKSAAGCLADVERQQWTWHYRSGEADNKGGPKDKEKADRSHLFSFALCGDKVNLESVYCPQYEQLFGVMLCQLNSSQH